jgi:monofunctional biosynthetic peptidoglycan transglycosylase
VVDKDTRDDFELPGEPLPGGEPVPDGPRSEGGPVGSPPGSPAAPEPVTHTASPAPEETPDAASAPVPTAEAAPEEPVAPEPLARAAGTEPDPVAPANEAAPGSGWSAAIADALSGEPEPSRETRPADDAAFTDAAEGLFRPGHADRTDETHLITLGRRLNPSLRVPKPELPVIEPRAEPAPAIKDAFEEKVTWAEGTWKDRLRIAARYATYAVAGYLALVLVLILLFRFVNPPGSMLMLTQVLTGTGIDRRWVPISAISSNLVRAVIVSEDGRFCAHSGVDTAAIREAIDRAARGTPRGASTISMQVTKNLFLWNAKSYVRKVIEIPLTLIMELVWPKQRILEVYLNIAEWGPGIFGAEAAAQHHFGKRAANLSPREAALLAAVLPNPVVRDAGNPSRQTAAKARVVQSRVKAYGAVASCIVSTRAAAGAEPASATTAVKQPSRPLRKPPPDRTRPQRDQADDWAPTLRFGPRE